MWFLLLFCVGSSFVLLFVLFLELWVFRMLPFGLLVSFLSVCFFLGFCCLGLLFVLLFDLFLFWPFLREAAFLLIVFCFICLFILSWCFCCYFVCVCPLFCRLFCFLGSGFSWGAAFWPFVFCFSFLFLFSWCYCCCFVWGFCFVGASVLLCFLSFLALFEYWVSVGWIYGDARTGRRSVSVG